MATNRDLITLVYDDFAINTLQVAERYGVTREKAYAALKKLSPHILCDGILDGGPNVGPVDNVAKNRRRFPVLWQSNMTYDDNTIDEVLQYAEENGVDLDEVVF